MANYRQYKMGFSQKYSWWMELCLLNSAFVIASKIPRKECVMLVLLNLSLLRGNELHCLPRQVRKLSKPINYGRSHNFILFITFSVKGNIVIGKKNHTMRFLWKYMFLGLVKSSMFLYLHRSVGLLFSRVAKG